MGDNGEKAIFSKTKRPCLVYLPAMHGSSIHFFQERPGLEMKQVSCSAHVFPRHFHDDLFAICLMHHGASHCQGRSCDNDVVRQGQFCLFNPGQVHACVPVGESVSFTMLYVHVDLVQSLAKDISQSPEKMPEFSHMICDSPDLISALLRLTNALDGPDRMASETLLVQTMGDLLRAYGGVAQASFEHGRQFVRRAKELLRSDLECKVTLKDLAATLGVSQYHFVRMFKRQTGVPPHVYRTQGRVDHARVLIRRGVPLAEIAQVTGFTDQSHFTNTFRLYTGATPGRYARAAQPQPQELS